MTDEDDFELDEEVPDLVEVPSDQNKVIPVTLLSGFLGSGKTTLLNYILTQPHGKRIAVIENEFSEGLGIEGMIAKSGVDGSSMSNFFELNNGCICCTVKDDLLITLEQLVLRKEKFDYILIETTGMANPGPVISTFWTDDQLGTYLKLDGVVCVVDSANILTYLHSDDISYEVRQQISYADRILLNKVDLVTPSKVEEIEKTIRGINRCAMFAPSTYSKVNLDFLLSINSYSTEDFSLLQESSSFIQCFPCGGELQRGAAVTRDLAIAQNPMNQLTYHTAQSSITSESFTFTHPFDMMKLRYLLDYLVYRNGDINDTNTASNKDASTVSISNQTVFGQNTPSLLPIVSKMKIYRMKGVFHIEQQSALYILQAVHNLFDLQPSVYVKDSPLDTTKGQSLLIIIGNQLDRNVLQTLFDSCIVGNKANV